MEYPIINNYPLIINNNIKNCECPCRHISRFIYRHNNNNNIPKTYNYGETDESDSDDCPSESIGSEDSTISEEEEEEDSFIENDEGISPNTRKELDKIKKILIKSICDKLN